MLGHALHLIDFDFPSICCRLILIFVTFELHIYVGDILVAAELEVMGCVIFFFTALHALIYYKVCESRGLLLGEKVV